MSCIQALYNHQPYPERTPEGVTCARVKRAIIGLIVSAILATCLYFISSAINNVSNPFHFSPQTLMGLAIGGACSIGLVGILSTVGWVYAAKGN